MVEISDFIGLAQNQIQLLCCSRESAQIFFPFLQLGHRCDFCNLISM